jgi:glyceraldehyde-3-phosphate dehydrogenase (NADP+)
MNTIPEQFQIKEIVHQNTYLIDGELKKWNGKTTNVFSTISSTEKYEPTLLEVFRDDF